MIDTYYGLGLVLKTIDIYTTGHFLSLSKVWTENNEGTYIGHPYIERYLTRGSITNSY